jgi:hypothetical protein
MVAHLTGVSAGRTSNLMAFANPVAWALDTLGFAPGTVAPSRREVTRRFRERLMEIHPDHGGDEREASRRIIDLGEARRILTEQ